MNKQKPRLYADIQISLLA